jgi:hypothetical protein
VYFLKKHELILLPLENYKSILNLNYTTKILVSFSLIKGFYERFISFVAILGNNIKIRYLLTIISSIIFIRDIKMHFKWCFV